MNVQAYLEECRRTVDAALDLYFSHNRVTPKLLEAMRYSLLAGGKRVRPALAFAAAHAVGGTNDDALPVACALEMIHTYSLIHDDLPAMDNDSLRRGRPTNHVVYGEGVAILAGDGLLTEAFHCLADPKWSIPADRKIDVVGIVAEGAGAEGMVAGQLLDLDHEGKEIDEKTLEQIHRNKTGKLLRAAILAGGRAAGAKGSDMDALDRYGKSIGLAFQIADDLLDVTSTAEQMGKNTKRDAENKKATYPAVLGIEESRRRATSLLDEALQALKPFGERGEPLAQIARYIVERKS